MLSDYRLETLYALNLTVPLLSMYPNVIQRCISIQRNESNMLKRYLYLVAETVKQH